MAKLKNILRWTIGSVMLTGALSLGGMGIVLAGEEGWQFGGESGEGGEYNEGWGSEREGEGGMQRQAMQAQNMGPMTAGQKTYQEECSACHMAYPAQLLPARSWHAITSNLDKHFGENAELLPDTQAVIDKYLQNHAADVRPNHFSRRFMRGLVQQDVPLRISQLPYFKRIHEEIPDRLVTGNKKVGSFSNCQACHGKQAQRGVFDEDTVDIPGRGGWGG